MLSSSPQPIVSPQEKPMSSKGKLVTFSLGKMLLFTSCKKMPSEKFHWSTQRKNPMLRPASLHEEQHQRWWRCTRAEMLKEQGPEVPSPGQQARLRIPISSPWSQHMEEGRRKGYEVTHGLKGKSRGESGLGRK